MNTQKKAKKPIAKNVNKSIKQSNRQKVIQQVKIIFGDDIEIRRKVKKRKKVKRKTKPLVPFKGYNAPTMTSQTFPTYPPTFRTGVNDYIALQSNFNDLSSRIESLNKQIQLNAVQRPAPTLQPAPAPVLQQPQTPTDQEGRFIPRMLPLIPSSLPDAIERPAPLSFLTELQERQQRPRVQPVEETKQSFEPNFLQKEISQEIEKRRRRDTLEEMLDFMKNKTLEQELIEPAAPPLALDDLIKIKEEEQTASLFDVLQVKKADVKTREEMQEILGDITKTVQARNVEEQKRKMQFLEEPAEDLKIAEVLKVEPSFIAEPEPDRQLEIAEVLTEQPQPIKEPSKDLEIAVKEGQLEKPKKGPAELLKVELGLKDFSDKFLLLNDNEKQEFKQQFPKFFIKDGSRLISNKNILKNKLSKDKFKILEFLNEKLNLPPPIKEKRGPKELKQPSKKDIDV